MTAFKRIVSFLLAVVLLVGTVPVNAAASETDPTVTTEETTAPTEAPTEEPTEAPTGEPTEAPTEEPTEAPTEAPTEEPTEAPTEAPTEEPTEAPAEAPTEAPTEEPTEEPTEAPTEPTVAPVEPEKAADGAAMTTGIAVDETNFPDDNFRAWILEQDYGKDGVLTESELANVTRINVESKSIASLKGIEYFTALTELSCNGNQLTKLDMTGNTALVHLSCRNNQLTHLDVSTNTALEGLVCENNQLTALDIRNNTKLKVLGCSCNQLTELDISNNTALTNLGCFENQLTALNLQKNTALLDLECPDNLLTALDVSQNLALTNLDCSRNRLTSLDVTNNASMVELHCSNNQLTELVVTANEALQNLACESNMLTALDVSNNPALIYLYCGSNQLTALDVSKNTALTTLRCNSNSRAITVDTSNQFDLSTLPGFDVSKASNWGGGTVSGNILTATAKTISYTYDLGNGEAETFTLTTTLNELAPADVEVNEENFPDAVFRKYILDQTYGADSVLTQEELAEVTQIDVSYYGIQDLTGIEYFTALTDLICYSNQLTGLDVSKNTALVQLSCYCNHLTELDVSKNTKLTELYCNNNFLTALDVSKNDALTILHCYNNQLTALDVGKNTALTELQCYSNQLASLDVRKNPALKEIICGLNSREITLDANNQFDLSTLPGFDVTNAHSWDGALVSGTTLTAYQETITYYYEYRDNEQTQFKLTAALSPDAPSYDVQVNAENFPDAAFRNYILSQSYGADGVLTLDELADIRYMYISSQGIASLKGIEHFVALTNLSCYGNQLTALDVSKNTALEYLYCSDNLLTALDVSRNPALLNLTCSGNLLTALNVSGNPALTSLNCSDNLLTVLNVSGNPSLKTLRCSDNQLTELNVSGNPALTSLYCYNNQLKALDVSGNPVLTDLSCGNNQLTALDISWNPSLSNLNCGENQLTSLNASSNPALKSLNCGNNQLTALDVTGNSALTELYCFDNQLTALDVSKNSALTQLNCDSNRLTSLDVGSNPALTSLSCSDNKLSTLDVSKNAKLQSLYCGNNQLTSLDLSNNSQCRYVGAYNNRKNITVSSKKKFDLSTLPGFDVTKASNWQGGRVSSNTLTAEQEYISYTYQLGNGKSATFNLYAENMAITVQISGNADTGKPKLSWNKVIGAAKYEIYRATSKHGPFTRIATVTGTSYTNNNAVAGKLYYYMVQPLDSKGHGNQPSNTVSRRCDLPRPSITISGVTSSGKIKVTWKKIDGAKSYEVWRSTSEDGEYTLMKTTTSTSYTNTSAKAGTRYYYKVRALHKTSSANSAYSAVKSRVCDLARPTVTLSGVSSTGKIKVSWKAIDGAVSYDIYRATGKNGTYKLLKNVTGTSFTDSTAVAGKTYYYQVVAVHSNTNANSAKSTAKNRVCDLARPDVKIELKNKKPRLTWEKISGATKYEVYRATSKSGKYTLVKTTTSTAYTNTGAKKGTTYYYKVKAIHSNSSANSAYSQVDSIRSN